jgi:amidase
LCEELGHEVEEAEIQIDSERVAFAYLIIVAAETTHLLNRVCDYMKRRPKIDELEALTHLTVRGGLHFSAADYCDAVHTLDVTRLQVAQFFDRYDMVMTPTLATPPPRIGELIPNKLHERIMLELLSRVSIGPLMKLAFKMMSANGFRFAPYCVLFNITGQPAMSVPLGMSSEGLPMGTHVVGQHGADGLLLRLAAQLERARPWDMKAPKNVLAELGKTKEMIEKDSMRGHP